jgi:hypothetical protein
MSADDEFGQIEEAFQTQGASAVFDLLMGRARETGNYRMLFNAAMLRARHRMGLPLIETEQTPQLTDAQRSEYEAALRDAARESGELCLAGGDIAGAWPYFKAIGEYAPVAAAIEGVTESENLGRLIEIAFQEGVHPKKGFELILQHHGICSAITWFASLRDSGSRQPCLRLLVETLYRDLADSLRRTIVQAEGVEPDSLRVAELIAGRDWLFESMCSYVDATHLTSILRYAPELEDDAGLRMALEMAEYGRRLDPMYHFRGDPPFEDTYGDYAVYLKALLREDADAGIAHFRAKIAGPEDTLAADVLVNLLSRLGRYREAIEVSIEYLPEAAFPLCQLAADYTKLRDLARERRDAIGFAAGLLQS